MRHLTFLAIILKERKNSSEKERKNQMIYNLAHRKKKEKKADQVSSQQS